MSDSIYNKISKARKADQAAGVLPEWYSTGGYQMFSAKYLYQAENWLEQIERICRTAASYMKDSDVWFPKFRALFWDGHLSASTPVLANTGTNRAMSVSCSGCYIGDSISEFYNVLSETAMLSKLGFGTSAYLGDIRPRGSAISSGGKSSGVLPVLKMYIQMAKDVSQGNTRRGSWAGYLPIDHDDFREVLKFLNDNPDDTNIGWIISDDFISRMNSGDIEAISRYKAAMKTKMTLGKGYFQFIDKCNRHRPEMYKKHKLDIKSSQLCLTGDTIIHVASDASGLDPVDYRLDDFCELLSMGFFGGKAFVKSWSLDSGTTVWSNVSNAGKTGSVSRLVHITTESGNVIKCTPDHQILTKDRGWVAAKDLLETDTLIES